MATTTTSSVLPTTTTSALPTTSAATSPEPEAEVLIPQGDGPFPAVVLVHGGGWIVGDPTSIQPLADLLTENGYLTVNTTYQLALQAPGFPTAFEDVECAVRFAASHPQSDGTVTIIGHSAGAHIGAVVALTGPGYTGDCPFAGPGVATGFIGLAGPYDVARLGPIMVPFFGTQQIDSPGDWDAGNPMLHGGDNPDLRALLLHGDADQVVPDDFSESFEQVLLDAGSEVELVVLEGVDHAGAQTPSLVGDIILDWLSRGSNQ